MMQNLVLSTSTNMKHSLVVAWRGAWAGKTLGRALFNETVRLECAEISGSILDLAGGENPGYLKLLPRDAQVTSTNRTASADAVAIDFDKPLPFADATFDSVLLFNALYIAENPSALAAEIFRVLKPGGVWFLSSPFIYNEMPEPHDYVRFTAEGLERLCKNTGFAKIGIIRVGERASAAINLLSPFFLFRAVRAVVFPMALLMDRLIPQRVRNKYPTPILYFVRCEKI